MANVVDIYELSPTQQGMLFHTVYAPESGTYLEQRHCLLEGELNIQAFKAAWQLVIDRHSVLRTEFHWQETDQPLQVVYDTVKLPWFEEDWQEFTTEQHADKLETFLTLERLQGFQLDQAPLMRCALFTLADNQHRFVWSYHHLLMDGWCNGVLLKEVLSAYQVICRHSTPVLPPTKNYRTYIDWLQQQDQAKAEAYWKEKLQGFSAPTPLGINRQRHQGSRSQETAYGEQQRWLSVVLSNDLQTFAKQSRLTLNTLFQGAWALMLKRYSGSDDVMFGITVSGRPPELSGVESMVGLFINTVPLRSHLAPNQPLLPWLQQLQKDQRDRETYGYSALTDLQSWSDVPRGTPLFESLLVFENYPISIEAATQGADLKIRDGQGYERTNYPMTLVVVPGESIQLSLRYDSGYISEAAAQRLLGHLETILGSFVVSPQQPLDCLPLLQTAEQQQLNQLAQGKIADVYPYGIQHQFERQTSKTPKATAVTFTSGSTKSESLSYQQLNERSNQLAHYLIRQDIGQGSRVGICLHRSLDMVVGLLGILKTGAAYVPLDPDFPSERLSYIVADAQIDLLLTNSDTAADLKQIVLSIDLDTQSHRILQQSTKNLSLHISLDVIAYILYTSGSTGKPKGVPIRHDSLANFLETMADAPGIDATDSLLAVTTLSFDIAALELFLPLVTGAQVVLTPREVVQDADQLAATLQNHSITMMQATPATWRLLMDSHWQGSANLKILCGGEALDLSLARYLLDQGNEVWNLYGPTETTIWSGALQITQEHLETGNVPIGTPIANTQFYVLDQQQRLVPMGIPGELYIGGSGLSTGYWQRPELTAKKFVAVPDGLMVSSERLYRTGDLVCYRENGTLDYLGRLDNQIKLRGFRIETGDIEAVLSSHEQINQAVVSLREQQLVAYVISNEKGHLQTDILVDDLRRLASRQLPVYMLPTAYAVLESFPLTPNGKVDRKALPAPEVTIRNKTQPRTPREQLIAGIWANVLSIQEVALEDNFFELGGHSLLATRVIAQVRQVLDVEVPLRSLFEQPTLADFIRALETNQEQSLPPILPRDKQLTLSYAQQRQWLMAQLAPDSRAYTIPTAVRLTGHLSVEHLHHSLSEVINRHGTLRTLYPTVDGQPVPQIVAPEKAAAQIAIEQTDLSSLEKVSQKVRIQELIQQESQRPFDLVQGPLWRARLLKLHTQEHILLFSLHHIVADGWSMGILLKELTSFYRAFQTNTTADVPSLDISYGDYAAWQRSLDLNHQLSYWQQQLENAAPLLELPTDFPRPAEPSAAGGTYEFRLSKQQTESLQSFSQQHGVTLFMTLLAAFKALLYRYSGITDLLIGTPIANRRQAQTENLIGLFVNTLVLRTDLSSNPRFSELLAQVRSIALDAYKHQDLPFEQLIDQLNILRSQSHTPLFQVMFALQNTPLESVSLDGLEWSPLTVGTNTAKFDLTLEMKQTSKGLVGVFEYRQDLFSADTMHRMAGHLRTLLKALPDNGQLRLSQLPMLLKQDLQQLQQWRQGTTVQPVEQPCIHKLFESQVSRNGDAIALVQAQTKVTYNTLNQQANQLARYLQEQGITPGERVGIWARRTPQTIAAILAILKSGATYVPLDFNYPLERLTWIVNDTELKLLLADDDSVTTEIKNLVDVVNLASIKPHLDIYPTGNLTSRSSTPDSLAYILYTSGSTGTPKGVCTSHRGIVRLVNHPNYVTLDASDSLLQAAPLTFDASTFEIWGALLNGGKLVLLSDQTPSLDDLGDAIVEHSITTLWLTSGLFNLMVDEQLNSLKPVRQLLAGGDVLSTRHLGKAMTALENTRILNGYGPTEGTTFTCCHQITLDDLDEAVPIGSPIDHTQIYVLDGDLQQVPPGLPGELYIGGAGLAQGYLNRPELTAEKFIPNPFYDIRQPGSDCFYLYKTGDRVRYRNDGTLEYLGRLDQQVKIRGFRIELGEIETALCHHPDIQQAVVIVDGETAENKRLVAYLQTVALDKQSSAVGPLSSQSLRQFLLSQLPDYMVPVKFIWLLDKVPLTNNGKINRRALPAPTWESNDAVTPQTDIEKILTKIWTVVLPVESVGIYDNFFDLGGDSILAMQIVSRGTQAGIDITPKQLFQHQTIAELAAVVELGQELAPQEPAVGLVPLTPIQHWFFEQSLATPHHFNQSVCLELPLNTNTVALEKSLTAIYQHHDAFRLRFTQDAQGWHQEYMDGTAPNIQWFNLKQLDKRQQDSVIATKAALLQQGLDLQTGPLVTFGGFNLGDSRPDQLLIVIHHLVIDGVSWRILLDDLRQAYIQVTNDGHGERPIYLAPKTHSYQAWAEHLEAFANSEEIQSAQDYWNKTATNQFQSIPQDHTNDNNTIDTSQRLTVHLDKEQTQALLQQVPSTYNAHINDILLTALALTLVDWTGQALIDLESYGRFSEDLDLSRTVGWFTCLYPVCLSIDTDAPVSKQIREIKNQLQAVPHDGLSYGLLRYLNNQKDLAITPAIGFNYLGQLDLTQSEFRRIPAISANQDPSNQRLHQIDINSWVEAGQFSVEWTFNAGSYESETIQRLARQFINHLEIIIDHSLSKEDADYTPDDFNLVQLDQSALDAVLAQVSFAGEQEVSP
ncbi:MAG: amino acid adenylation domain-containing protein [Cyanobacteria bacterium P01_D01_bin.156]